MIAVHRTTTSAASDVNADGPEYVGRVLCITLGRWTVEFTVARCPAAATPPDQAD